MAWNRVQYKEQARAQADAEDSARWTTDLVNFWFANVFDEGWRRILNGDAAYRYTKITTLSADADGLIQISAVNALISPARMYRVLDPTTVRDKRLAGPAEYVLEPYVTGDVIRFGPVGVGQPTFWVNSLPQNPQSFTDASADMDDVTWPDGHELVLANHLAGMLLTKGGVQTPQAADILALTDVMYTTMIQALMDRTTRHQQVLPTDAADQWSGGMIY